jgi:hypothetical protein
MPADVAAQGLALATLAPARFAGAGGRDVA